MVAGAEDLLGGRRQEWRFDLLDRDERFVRTLSERVSGSLDVSPRAVVRTSGVVEVRTSDRVPWDEYRVQVSHRARADGPWRPVGRFIMATTPETWTGSGLSQSVELSDKVAILDGDGMRDQFGVPAGVRGTDVIAQVLAGSGETAIEVVPSAKVLRTPMVWEAGTSRREIVNAVSDAIGYAAVRVSPTGVFQSEPYLAPALRGAAWRFLDDSESITTPEFRVTPRSIGVRNRVVGIARGDVDTPPLVAVAEKALPSGLWRTRVEEIDAVDSESLSAAVFRLLQEELGSLREVEFRHAWVPLGPHDAFQFRKRRADVDGLFVLKSQKIDLSARGLVDTVGSEVAA